MTSGRRNEGHVHTWSSPCSAKTQTVPTQAAEPCQAKGVALIEGLWTRYFPAVEHARAAVELGVKIQCPGTFSAPILL